MRTRKPHIKPTKGKKVLKPSSAQRHLILNSFCDKIYIRQSGYIFYHKMICELNDYLAQPINQPSIYGHAQ